MSITFKSFLSCIEYVTNVKKPVLLRSKHGIGKSELVYQFAKKINLPVIERRASQMTEGDLLGLPKLNNNITEWCPPEWLYTACNKPVVLFIDEIDRATTEVRQGFFELTDSRKISGWTLHEDTLIFAAVNSGDYAAQYQVGEMDPAELSRWTVFDLEPDIEDWLNWASENNNIHPVIINFITSNHNHLEHNDEFEPNKVYPSRRSWHRLNDCLVKGKLFDNKKSNSIFNLAQAFVGLEAAIKFHDYVNNYKYEVLPEDIIDKGEIKLTKDFSINEHSELIERIEHSKYVEEILTDEQIDNIANYFLTLPSECAMKLFTIIGSNKNNHANNIALHKISKFKKHFQKLLANVDIIKKNKKNKSK